MHTCIKGMPSIANIPLLLQERLVSVIKQGDLHGEIVPSKENFKLHGTTSHNNGFFVFLEQGAL